jgi:hypothetical protein
MGTAGASDLITVVHCDEHDLFRRGLVDMLSTAEATQKALANGWISPFEFSEGYENDREGQYEQ